MHLLTALLSALFAFPDACAFPASDPLLWEWRADRIDNAWGAPLPADRVSALFSMDGVHYDWDAQPLTELRYLVDWGGGVQVQLWALDGDSRLYAIYVDGTNGVHGCAALSYEASEVERVLEG